jgi:hypothetical protein
MLLLRFQLDDDIAALPDLDTFWTCPHLMPPQPASFPCEPYDDAALLTCPHLHFQFLALPMASGYEAEAAPGTGRQTLQRLAESPGMILIVLKFFYFFSSPCSVLTLHQSCILCSLSEVVKQACMHHSSSAPVFDCRSVSS